ncbi:MAG: NnrU family protein [Betaproteobacteria bacterium]|nr:NnrU family protein [Betaproteobacteria bacterium]MCC6246295.1 NnrU family protein [Rubrivivax sp.]
MTWLVLGLVIFLGAHSVRIVAEGWRTATVARLGANGWKGLYSLVSAVGLALIVVGYGMARTQPVLLWMPPVWMRHVAALLNLVAIVLIVAAYVPRNHFKVRLRHPMILGVKVWALAHLLSNQMLADVVLFGAFLAWAVFDYRAARARDRAAGAAGAAALPVPSLAASVVALAVGVGAWAAIAFWAHGALFGVRPFGG